MNITHTWSVTKLDTKSIGNKNNVVTEIHWKVISTDGVNTFESTKVQPLEYVEASDFIEYANLTEADVLGWLQESMGDRWQMFQDIAEINLSKMQNPPTEVGLPWAQ